MSGKAPGRAYEIVVESDLDPSWATWFEGFNVLSDGSTTKLSGTVVDQASLHGLIARFRDLGIPILSIRLLPNNEEYT